MAVGVDDSVSVWMCVEVIVRGLFVGVYVCVVGVPVQVCNVGVCEGYLYGLLALVVMV